MYKKAAAFRLVYDDVTHQYQKISETRDRL